MNTGYANMVGAATHFEAPAASSMEPSAEKAREVKHCPEVRLPAARLSDASRPPAMSRRPSMVPCNTSCPCQTVSAPAVLQTDECFDDQV